MTPTLVSATVLRLGGVLVLSYAGDNFTPTSHHLRYNKDYGVFRFDVQNQWNSEQKCNDKGKPETWNVRWCSYEAALCNNNNDCGGDYPKCTRRNNGPKICWN